MCAPRSAITRWYLASALLIVSCLLLTWDKSIAAPAPTEPAQASSSPERERLELEKLGRESDKLKHESEKLEAETKNLGDFAERERLERSRLERESEKLAAETGNLAWWRQLLASLLAPLATIGAAGLALWGTIRAAKTAYLQAMAQERLAHKNAIQQAGAQSENKVGEAIHAKRMALYPVLIKATAPLAIYFPINDDLSPLVCEAMGRTLSRWYFDEGGLYLSREARDCYFVLAAALSLASDRNLTLRVPPANQRNRINDSDLKDYRDRLKIGPEEYLDSRSLEKWKFGGVEKLEDDAEQIRDYVLLQELSSRLRSALIKDLHTRRLPAYRRPETTV